jgi:hypothetical protein
MKCGILYSGCGVYFELIISPSRYNLAHTNPRWSTLAFSSLQAKDLLIKHGRVVPVLNYLSTTP